MQYTFTQTEYDKIEKELDRLYDANNKLQESLEDSYVTLKAKNKEILELASYVKSLEHTIAQHKAFESTLIKRHQRLDMQLTASKCKPATTSTYSPTRKSLEVLASLEQYA